MPSSASDSGAWRYFPVAGKPLISDTLQEQWVFYGVPFLQRTISFAVSRCLDNRDVIGAKLHGVWQSWRSSLLTKVFFFKIVPWIAMVAYCRFKPATQQATGLDWNHCGLSPFSRTASILRSKRILAESFLEPLLISFWSFGCRDDFGCLWICFLLVKAYDSWCWHQSNFVAVPSCSCASFFARSINSMWQVGCDIIVLKAEKIAEKMFCPVHIACGLNSLCTESLGCASRSKSFCDAKESRCRAATSASTTAKEPGNPLRRKDQDLVELWHAVKWWRGRGREMRITMRQTSFVQTSWCRWDERQRVEPHESHAVITAHVTAVTHTLQVRLHTREGSALLSWKCCTLDPFRADCRLWGSLAVSWLHSIQKHKLIIVDLKCGRADFKLGQSGLRLGEEILRLEPGNRLVLEYQAHVLPVPIASNCPAHWWYRAGAGKSSEVFLRTFGEYVETGRCQWVRARQWHRMAQHGTIPSNCIQLHPTHWGSSTAGRPQSHS